MKTYIFYDDNGKILRTETRKKSFSFNEKHLVLQGEVDIDFDSELVANGSIVKKTELQMRLQKSVEQVRLLKNRQKDAASKKVLYLAAKNESPAIIEYLKEIGVVPTDMDDLIK